jgi:hypothetical protein
MRNWILIALLFAAAAAGCNRKGLPAGDPGSAGTGVGIVGVGGNGGQGVTGAAGMAAACTGASDDRLVLADQRILRLTDREMVNTIRYLFGDTEAAALVRDQVIGDSGDVARRFPPLEGNTDIDSVIFAGLEQVAQHVGDYVLANFATVTACPTVTDACATTYLDRLAGRAYRRQLTQDEQTRFSALYTKLRNPQTVNGYLVTFTVEEATSYAVQALLTSPQMLWRWEIGDPVVTSASPAGVPLTDAELASHLAFFLADQPPGDTLLAAANGKTLRANLAAHVDALLASQASRDWLRTIIETYLTLNQLPAANIDPTVFPVFSPALAQDMGVESRKFLDNALWNGVLTDLLLSRTAFLNATLAANVYGVPVPGGATATSFVQTTLPADQRSGLLTNAGFLTTRSGPDPSALAVPRGMFIASALLCMPDPGDFGVALDNYDALGRFRTVDETGRPIDAHTRLPAALGGDAVANGVELAQKLATKPAFTNCMARALLQYAMVDRNTNVEVPLPPQQAGCATADVVQRYHDANGKTFTDLVRATAAAPAFVLRRAAP